MIDNIITNTLLPALSREFLKRSLAKEELKEAKVTIENGDFAYAGHDLRAGGPMTNNRFEQVDELQLDAINLTLVQKSDGQVGIIYCPKSAAPNMLPADLTSEEMPVQDAVVGAIQLANSRRFLSSSSIATTFGRRNGASYGVTRERARVRRVIRRASWATGLIEV